MSIVLTGGAVLTVNAANEFLPSADIRIEGDAIAALGPAGSLARPGERAGGADRRDACSLDTDIGGGQEIVRGIDGEHRASAQDQRHVNSPFACSSHAAAEARPENRRTRAAAR